MKGRSIAIVGTVGVPANYGGFETLAENLVKHGDGPLVPLLGLCGSWRSCHPCRTCPQPAGAELRIAVPPTSDYNDGIAITSGANMAALTIRNIDDEVKNRLRLQAAQHGCSMEQEVREILLRAVLPKRNQPAFAQRIQKHFADLELDALPIPKRLKVRTPPKMES